MVAHNFWVYHGFVNNPIPTRHKPDIPNLGSSQNTCQPNGSRHKMYVYESISSQNHTVIDMPRHKHLWIPGHILSRAAGYSAASPQNHVFVDLLHFTQRVTNLVPLGFIEKLLRAIYLAIITMIPHISPPSQCQSNVLRSQVSIMPPKGSKRNSSGGGGSASKKAKTGGGPDLPSVPPAALKLPHMALFDDWLILWPIRKPICCKRGLETVVIDRTC